MTPHTQSDRIYTMNHNPNNTHVLVNNIVQRVFRAHWHSGGVAYMLSDGRMVYSWEQSVQPMESK